MTDIFDHHVAFDPAADFEPFLKSVPGKWVVYLLADENHQPVQLLCVKNLRYSLERRLGPAEPDASPSRRVNYRELIRHVYWRRVDSALEADAVYLEAARQVFPQTYRGMTGMRPAWFVHVNPDTAFPRWVKSNDPTGRSGTYFGPIEDKHEAQKLVHLIENLFDLCRDYSILTQSPAGGPCPWKQMDKCVGPCDGTISMQAYRAIIAYSVQVLADPRGQVRQQTQRMQQAAAALRFELAAKIKSWIEQLSQVGKGPLRYVRPLDKFNFISLQRGPRAGTARVFLITPGRIDEIAGLVAEPLKPAELLRFALELAEQRRGEPLDAIGAERVGVVAHHLFVARQKHGVFIPLGEVEEKSFIKGFGDLQNQKPQDEPIGEGVIRELQSM
jgi:excinuclease ABC subunit C